MTDFLHHTWLLARLFSMGGLAVAFAGVAIFGWHFVSINARAARVGMNNIPGKSWHGKGAKFGLRALAIGVALQLASFVLATILRNGAGWFR